MASNEADCSGLIAEFCRVTGVEPDRARIFLEAAGWNYNLAITNFYEEADNVSEDTFEEKPQASPPSAPVAAASPSSSRIVTMRSLMQNEEKNEEGQAFYAGGSVRSGQQVLSPGKNKGHIVEEMFKAAKSHGGEVVESTGENRCSSAHLRAFRGTGYVLGTTADGSSPVADADNSGEANQRLDICLRAWRTGFTIENGQLREYSDPRNKEFLDAIRRGEIPQELIHKARGGEVDLSIEDHSHEDYVPPNQLLLAFTGQGHRLGSPTPRVSGAPSKKDAYKNEAEAEKNLNVDHSKPVTMIQVRLADGSRITLKLNHTHTIGDIRQYLVIARPEYSATVFSLMTSYPPAELTDDNATVQEANLLNSVIVQKLL